MGMAFLESPRMDEWTLGVLVCSTAVGYPIPIHGAYKRRGASISCASANNAGHILRTVYNCRETKNF